MNRWPSNTMIVAAMDRPHVVDDLVDEHRDREFEGVSTKADGEEGPWRRRPCDEREHDARRDEHGKARRQDRKDDAAFAPLGPLPLVIGVRGVICFDPESPAVRYPRATIPGSSARWDARSAWSWDWAEAGDRGGLSGRARVAGSRAAPKTIPVHPVPTCSITQGRDSRPSRQRTSLPQSAASTAVKENARVACSRGHPRTPGALRGRT